MNYYFDLGAADGDTIRQFIRGEMVPIGGDIREWNIIGYEPVVYEADTLEKLKAEYPAVNLDIHRAAAWIDNGPIVFAKSNSQLNSSTMMSECEMYENSTLHQVYAINFEQVIMSLDANDTIIVKMDIEGAEYVILERLIETKAIKNINRLFVEFHDWIMPEEYKQRHAEIVAKCPITIEGWG